MDLWTVQTEEFYEKLRKNGVIHTDPDKVDKEFRSAYDWLACRCGAGFPLLRPALAIPSGHGIPGTGCTSVRTCA